MSIQKKLRKNKVIVLLISVCVLWLVYAGIEKAIDNYQFNNNIETIEVFDENNDSEEIISTTNQEEGDDVTTLEGEISNEETELIMEEKENENVSLDDNTNKEENKIYIYITGEVNVPGVVVLDEGSRIVDAINCAGGTTSKANLSKVNLVYVLQDGMKVNIPNDNDLKNNLNFEYITMNSGDGGNNDYHENDREDAGYSKSKSENYNIVNINTATQTELESLPGIGPSLALKIINYRKENGKFSSIEELKNVSGIGESKFENLKKYIKV